MVYQAVADDGRSVAVKLLRSDADGRARARFLREAKAAAAVASDGIVAVLDAGEATAGVLWYAMELVDARSLERRILERGPLRVYDAADVVAKVARAVHAAHEKGVIHRDLKPSNVLLVGGYLHRPKVADFGLAVVPGASRLTESGAFVGTPCYASPETVRGEDAARQTDVYGIGAILYECLVGRAPFMGPSLNAILKKVLTERPTAPRRTRPQIPPALERICLQCLEKSPAHRPRSALDVALALEKAIQNQGRESLADRARASVATASFVARVACVVALGLALGLEAGFLTGLGAGLVAPDANDPASRAGP